jgi:hypothetical protein
MGYFVIYAYMGYFGRNPLKNPGGKTSWVEFLL